MFASSGFGLHSHPRSLTVRRVPTSSTTSWANVGMTVHVLIVDDQPTVRSGLRSLLASRPDWRISGEAADGLEAIEKAKAFHPDLILVDVAMPRMNALEATRRLRRDVPDAKGVTVSHTER